MNDMTQTDPLTLEDFTIDCSDLFSQEQFDREVKFVFWKSWLVLGHDLEIPNPGDFLVRDLPGLKLNVLVIRGKDGVVRAFHNACQHRGAMLVCEAAGNKPRGLSCPYHGWTYNLDGSVRGITDRDQFPVEDLSTLALKPIRCDVRHTYIFINPDGSAPSLDEWLEGVADPTLYEGYFERFHSFEMISAEIEANWKLVIDNFSEGYHTLFVHKGTLTDYSDRPDDPMRHLVAFQPMKRHSRSGLPANMQHKTIPVEELAFRHTPKSTPSYYGDSDGLPHGVNFGQINPWAFDGISLYPNKAFLPGKDFCVEFRIWPISPTRTRVEASTLLPKPKTYGERVAQEYPYALGREVVSEDLSVLEKQQKMIANGAIKALKLSFQETILAQRYRNIRRDIQENAQ